MNHQSVMKFYEGTCMDAYQFLGAHLDPQGVHFTVYAPGARSVSVIGSFNDWRPDAHPMKKIKEGDLWDLYIPGVRQWDTYKYHIVAGSGEGFDKSDPYGFYSETRPATASKVVDLHAFAWTDQRWMTRRDDGLHAPVSIYEVYAGGWRKNGEYDYSYDMLREQLIPYVKDHGFTHIELMPLTEYPFDGSWGYQVSGYFALTSRYGNPAEFSRFVNACHLAGLGVIMDMVPVHFVKDAFGLARFDGSPLYEYAQSRDAESQWGTLNFDLGRNTVRSFLNSAAAFWLDTYHIDGIRMDAVANLIYWGGNKQRGVNEGSLGFIRQLNTLIKEAYPSVMLIAEDSSDYPKVTEPVPDGGLGFDYKWDLGWMNDTLKYFEIDPVFRYYHHNQLTFSMAYFYSEHFIMPLSHDENVHSKKTIVDRMWGSYDQKFSQVRALYAYMFAHPGKKLNFMGNEIASFREFDEKKELDWFLLKYPRHDAFLKYFRDLNSLYVSHACLWENDYDGSSFRWIDADNAAQSVYSFYRESESEYLICVMNLSTPSYEDFELTVPAAGTYHEILNTEDSCYDGSGFCNRAPLKAAAARGGHGPVIRLKLAPLSAVWLVMKKRKKRGRTDVQR